MFCLPCKYSFYQRNCHRHQVNWSQISQIIIQPVMTNHQFSLELQSDNQLQLLWKLSFISDYTRRLQLSVITKADYSYPCYPPSRWLIIYIPILELFLLLLLNKHDLMLSLYLRKQQECLEVVSNVKCKCKCLKSRKNSNLNDNICVYLMNTRLSYDRRE